MLDLISKISPEVSRSSSKIGPTFSLNDKYICFIIDFLVIEVLEYNKKSKKSVRLEGDHKESIKCLKLSREVNDQTFMCSCSSDSLIVWYLDASNSNFKKRIVGSYCFKYEPTHCEFHPSNKIIAVSNADQIDLFDIKSCSNINVIKLNDCVNFFEFSLFDLNQLFVTTTSNLLLCYNITDNFKIQEHRTISSNSFLNIKTLDDEPIVLVSSTEGLIYVFEFKLRKFNELRQINLKNLYLSFLKQSNKSPTDNINICTGLNLFKIKTGQHILTCSTSSCLFLIDFKSSELIYLIDFKQMGLLIPQMVEFSLVDNKQINTAFLYLFNNEINIFKCADIFNNSSETDSNKINSNTEEFYLSVFPSSALLIDSPLNEQIQEKELIKSKLPSMQDYIKTNSLTKKANFVLDKPVTFTSKIRSSGYSNSNNPKRERFTPLINKDSKSSSLSSLDFSNNKQKPNLAAKKEFKFELPNVLNKKFNATDKSSPINLIKFSDDGQNLALVSNDNIIQYLSASNIDRAGLVYNGHNDLVRSIDISHDGKLLISASNDKTCKLWSLKKSAEILLDIKSLKINDSNSLSFKKEICSSNFYYMDKFLLIGNDKNLFLCKYYIDKDKNDVQRYLNNSFCKLIKKFELTFAQSLTTVSAINSFYSYLVLCGGTDKSIEVFDMNEAKSCLTIHEAHNRPFHQLVQNESEFNQMSYDLFLTNSVADGIKLWDIRIAKCVNKFESHVNRYLPSKVSFSPDSNYIAAGSEDRSTFIYDLRMNGVIKKLGIFSDNVLCSQFNPKKSQLICGTQDGKLYSY